MKNSIEKENRLHDPHSFSNLEVTVLSHLNLNLKADFDRQVLSGYAEWTIEQAGADTIILDTRDLDIMQVDCDGRKNTFSLGKADELLGRPLYIPLSNTEVKQIRIYYSTLPAAAAIQWLSPRQTKGGKYPFLFTQSQAILARSWIPCQDAPSARFTYEADIEVPEGLMALMSAENDTLLHEGGKYHFKMGKSIPSYLMALTIGDLRFHSLGNECGVYAEPGEIEAAASEFRDLPKMLSAASALYGPYRWGRYDVVVLPPSFPFGGMENPRLTFATPTIIAGDRSLVSLLAHELAHSWSGNLVTNASWNDFWLNEGFTVYFENRIMERLYGKDYAAMHEVLGMGELQKTLTAMNSAHEPTSLKMDLKGKDPDNAVSDIAYEKGRFFLRTIEDAVGREKWDAFLNSYFSEHAFGSISTEQFISLLQERLLQNDSSIKVSEWIYGSGLPDNCPKVHSVEKDKAEAEAGKFLQGTPAEDLATKGWHSFQWQFFLRTLPETLHTAQMAKLDKTFQFSNSGNCEILCDWFQYVIRNHYDPAYPSLENFLLTVGRRKFIQPLYTLMAQDKNMQETARAIYKKARPGYHSVATHTIDKILNQ